MTIALKVQKKMLWGRAAARCSMPECRSDLFEDATATDDPTLIGENCHIVAESDDGPRADPAMPVEQRNSYGNLILLCRNHHKVVDAQPLEYSVQKLLAIKRDHEEWVRTQLGLDTQKQLDDEQYAEIIDRWERLAHVADWLNWSAAVLSNGQPSMPANVDNDLAELRHWFLTRIWPGRYPKLEEALRNFFAVLNDFQNTFRQYSDPIGDGAWLWTRKFYQIQEYDEERYHRLLRQFEFHVDLVQDLMLELTRAANHVCDCVRQFLFRNYRLSEGRIAIETGPTQDLKMHTVVVQYSSEERGRSHPYPGLDDFLNMRKERDMYFGQGLKAL